ncbi:conserved hypothetical protein [Paraburkholderia piptadeniae]|uniref:Uncharacterized protein n=1 Tax=Paraburkholderia piptadeniae TaxID=1701573 RepID=A0A1N7S236_9BURK|nr:hypothetical protein [Paraburkholderia piptadeniae]SIT41462.1 conserved hypothetical protein [Paraburkholderia piptadeniae]
MLDLPYSLTSDGKVLAKDQPETQFTEAIITADSSVWFSAYRFGWGYCAFALPAEVVCEGLGAADESPKQLVLAFGLGKHRIRKAIAEKRLPGTGERITLCAADL